VESLLSNDSFLHSVNEPADARVDDLRRKLAEARLISVRLHAERDRLKLPPGRVALSKGTLDHITKDSMGFGKWISKSGPELSVLRAELREKEQERTSLTEIWTALRSSPRRALGRAGVGAEIKRLTGELASMRTKFASATPSRQELASFIEASQTLFSLLKQESQLHNQ
jgi:hypothetical protein